MLRQLVRSVVRHPTSILHYARERFAYSQDRKHRSLVGRAVISSHAQLVGFLAGASEEEFLQAKRTIGSSFASALARQTEAYSTFTRQGGFTPSHISLADACALYAIVRHTKPDFAVETGVSDGMSTLSILLALRENKSGILQSIDLPAVGKPQLIDRQPGWLVPEDLRGRWRLALGQSKRLLPAILEGRNIDFFLHDSEHSYSTMKWELSLAIQHSRKGALICCDDALTNDAFLETAIQHGAGWAITNDTALGGFKVAD